MSHDLMDLLDRTASEPSRRPNVDEIRARGRQIRSRRRLASGGGALAIAVVAWVLLGQLPADVGPRIDEGPDVVGPSSDGVQTPGDDRSTARSGAALASGEGEFLARPRRGEVVPGNDPATADLTRCEQRPGDTTGIVVRWDVAEPQCLAVTPGQQVELVNLAIGPSDNVDLAPTFTASLGKYRVRLRFGENLALDRPVSTYLGPGVHTIESDFAPARIDVWVLDAPAQSAGEQAILDALVAFAHEPDTATFADLPLADTVRLGLGQETTTQRSAADLRDPAAWVLDEEEVGDIAGPFSALDRLTTVAPADLASTAGPHPHCAQPPRPAPEGLGHLRRLSLQGYADASCFGWFSVDAFVDDDQRIVAVTLDLWDP